MGQINTSYLTHVLTEVRQSAAKACQYRGWDIRFEHGMSTGMLTALILLDWETYDSIERRAVDNEQKFLMYDYINRHRAQ